MSRARPHPAPGPAMPVRTLRPGRVSLVLLLVAAAAGYGAGAATLWFVAAGQRLPTAADPDPKAGRAAVVALGRVRPARLLTVVGPPGDQVAEILAREGEAVTAGQDLVRLASHADRQAEVSLLQ